jgi:lipoyl(octanoyl) transferase
MSDEIEVRWLENVEYADGLALQNELVEACLAGTEGEKLLLIEHQPVYTIGRTRDLSSLRSPEALPHPLFETNRGGQATWHGPGQLVAYPILRLQERGKDLHRYMRFLEEVIILTCARQGVTAGRREGLTGVWVDDRKVASIGVGVRKWISMHGLALNVTRESLAAFQHITPCGIANVEMTSLESEAAGSQNVKVTGFALADIFMEKLPELSE